MPNVFNQTLNVSAGFFEDLGSQGTITGFMTYINNDMNQIPAVMMLIVIATVIIVGLIRNGHPTLNAFVAGSYVTLVIGFFFRLIPLIGDKILIALFFITGILTYVAVAHKHDAE